MSRYAEGTGVSVDQSRQEIERTLGRFGATEFAYGWSEEEPPRSVVMFRANGRQIKMTLHLPDRMDRAFTHTPDRGLERSSPAARRMYEQEVRRRWRALALVVKAKLAGVEAGVTTFEDEFLAYTRTPSGATVGEWLEPQLERAYASGQMPELLPGGER